MISVEKFGTTKDGREVLAFTLTDGERYVRVLSLGGILQSIVVPDREGRPTDVLLGYNSVREYEENGGYLGALVGRYANRIGKGILPIDGTVYHLYCNDRGNHLHGGKVGFNAKIWTHEILGDELLLFYESPDGEENYPGTLKVVVTYTFRGGELRIHYHAVSDRKTAVALTNHAYFNLSGEGSGSALGDLLMLDSDFIVPTDDALIPQGGFRAVAGTPFDFNASKAIGKEIEAIDEDLKKGNGYDHCFLLKNRCGEYTEYGRAESPETGIVMRCFTDMPAVQFYAGNGLDQRGKTAYYGKRAGFCLETEAIPNNVNVPEYAEKGSSLLEAGQVYSYTAAYRFEVRK